MAEEENKPAELPQELVQRSYEKENSSSSKTTWPELVGMAGEEAKTKIEQEIPGITVHLIPQGSFVTMDFRTDRVRIFIDSSGKVASPPRIG